MALFTDEEQTRIHEAIVAVEKRTTAEVRVCVEKKCSEDVLLRAARYFEKLGMTNTAERHGVMIYLATADRKFAIIGDKGINQVVPADFWDVAKNAMLVHFKKDELIEGIIAGLTIAGEALNKSFPNTDGKHPNQLPDDVAFMDGE